MAKGLVTRLCLDLSPVGVGQLPGGCRVLKLSFQ